MADLIFDGSRTITGTPEDDFIDGSSADENTDINSSSSNPAETIPGLVIEAGSGVDIVTGSSYKDIIFGEDGADELVGLAGNDQINGGDGDDILDNTLIEGSQMPISNRAPDFIRLQLQWIGAFSIQVKEQ